MKLSKIVLLFASFLIVFGFSGCGGSDDSTQTGTMSLNLTDAPLIDELNVTGVYITVSGVEYHMDGKWQTMEEFNTSVNPINLLEWQDGESIALGDFQLPAGKYTQMRFMLDAQEETGPVKSSAGCFIEFDGDTNETLYVASGSQTGYKAVGNFEVPVDGRVSVTADFDVRKSIVASGNGAYKLKPTIKLVVTSETGVIEGTVVGNLIDSNTYVVYAYEYEDGQSTWNDNETTDANFPNAATSSRVKESDTYRLSFLEAGSYDLIVATYDEHGEYSGYDIETGIPVENGEITTFTFTLP